MASCLACKPAAAVQCMCPVTCDLPSCFDAVLRLTTLVSAHDLILVPPADLWKCQSCTSALPVDFVQRYIEQHAKGELSKVAGVERTKRGVQAAGSGPPAHCHWKSCGAGRGVVLDRSAHPAAACPCPFPCCRLQGAGQAHDC